MPGKVKVKIVAGRNLPVMDRSSDTTDAYVEIKLGNTTFKTDVCRKSLNPQWNSEWYRFEMDDAELQDEPLQIRLMDHDTYSANDAIGKVYLDLNPLLLSPAGASAKTVAPETCPTSTNSLSGGNAMSGWFPVYDTMHGIRGEVNVIVKVELFSDFNKFRQSSCGVQFFNSCTIPAGYHATTAHGMVEELVASGDPEYQWIDKIRTPRASNEARQTLFSKLSGEVRRRIGLKALDSGANAVVGYLQCFDLEAECGIVVRGLGTAVSLVRLQEPTQSIHGPYAEDVIPASPLRKSPMGVKHMKGFLAPGSPKSRRSKSPQLKQPFSEYKPKRLASYTRSLSDNVSERDNVSLQVLFEQEDMRGEPVSSRRKIFDRLSSFPRRKIKALRGYSRSKSENMATTLIRSIMDPSSFSLDRVPEEMAEFAESKMSDTDSVVHPLRYEDGHLVSISSSSSDISSSEIEDISDVSSISSSLQEYTKKSEKGSRFLPTTSFDNSVTSSKDDDLSDKEKPGDSRFLPSTSFDNSVTSSKDDELSDKEGKKPVREVIESTCKDFESTLQVGEVTLVEPPSKKQTFTSTVHVVLSRNEANYDDLGENSHDQFSSSVTFDDSPSPPRLVKSQSGGTLMRQLGFDHTFSDRRKRSDTPPMSEMDPYMRFSLEDKDGFTETIFGPVTPIKVAISQPSLDEDLKSRPVANLSFPESVRHLPSVSVGHITNPALATVHTVTLSDRKSSIDESEGASEQTELCKSVDVSNFQVDNSTEPCHKALPVFITSSVEKSVGDIFDLNKGSIDKASEGSELKMEQFADVHMDSHMNHVTDRSVIGPDEETPKTNDTINKIHKNPFEFPFDVDDEKKMVFDDLLGFPDKNDSDKFTGDESAGNGVQSAILGANDSLDDCVTLLEDCNPVSSNVLSTVKGTSKIGRLQSMNLKNYQISLEDFSEASVETVIQRYVAESKREHSNSDETDGESLNKISANEMNDSLDESTIENDVFHDEELQDFTGHSSKNTVVNDNKTSPPPTVDPSTPGDSLCQVPLETSNADLTSEYVTSNHPPPTSPHPLVKSLSASGLVEPCHGSVPSRSVPEEAATGIAAAGARQGQSPIKISAIHRRSSDSDLSITPKGNSLTSSGDRSSTAGGSYKAFPPLYSRLAMKKELLDSLEFPFLTVTKFPPGFIIHIAGTVASRSVKLLERVSNVDEPESRDAWWTELRLEVRAHMRAMACNAVIGYSETTAICDDVCVLSACGTAAVVTVRPALSDTPEPPASAPPLPPPPPPPKHASLDKSDSDNKQGSDKQSTPVKPDSGGKPRLHSDSMDQPDLTIGTAPCAVCHLPFNPTTVPLPMTAIKCAVCGKRKVPDVLLATVEPPEGLALTGRSCLLHVFVTRPKAHARGETNACVVSDCLPFVEYDIYKQLVNKMRVNGMNAVFGLRTQISLGERMVAAVTSGTAAFVEALPSPAAPTVAPGESCPADGRLAKLLRSLQETVKKNREFYQVKPAVQEGENNSSGCVGSDTEESEDDLPELDIHAGNKEACVFMVDDEHDVEVASQLLDPHPPEGFLVTATESLTSGPDSLDPVTNLQMFTQIWRSRVSPSKPNSDVHKHFHRLLQGIYYKLRRMTPCAVGNMKFCLALPEPDEVQISIVGMAVGLGESLKNVKSVRRRTVGAASKQDYLKKADDGDMIFSLEEDQETGNGQISKNNRPKSPNRPTRRSTHISPKERYGVDITPLSYIPGGRIERYLGNLNFFFIRETSCIREGGGLSGFVHSFVAEVLAILRAHVTALGGNALVAFFLNECVILNNPHKNHGQCLINVGGDAVSVSYID